jgi:hypothetical protein
VIPRTFPLYLPSALRRDDIGNALLAIRDKTLMARHREILDEQQQPYLVTRHADGRITRKPIRTY